VSNIQTIGNMAPAIKYQTNPKRYYFGNVANHYLIMFSPAGFEEFLKTTSVPAPDNAVSPTEPPRIAVQNVFELASEYGIQFGSGLAITEKTSSSS
jgi:hypothetical protein